jgi:hypothetical protein
MWQSCPEKETDMHRAQSQAGLTFFGLILILIPVGLGIYILLKAAPVYIEAYSVGDVVSSMRKEFDLKEKSKDEIANMIRKRFDVNDIRSVEKEDVKIIKTPNEVSISVDYEVKVPLFGNIALALTFHKAALIR